MKQAGYNWYNEKQKEEEEKEEGLNFRWFFFFLWAVGWSGGGLLDS